MKTVPLPALDLPEKVITPMLESPAKAVVTKFWVVPESFMTPAPLKVSPAWVVAVMEKASAPEAKTISFTSVAAESRIVGLLEVAKVAVSLGPFGTVFGIQFAAVFQSPLVGLVRHVAPHVERSDRGRLVGDGDEHLVEIVAPDAHVAVAALGLDTVVADLRDAVAVDEKKKVANRTAFALWHYARWSFCNRYVNSSSAFSACSSKWPLICNFTSATFESGCRLGS